MEIQEMKPEDLKVRRQRLKMTQFELARRMNVDIRTIKRWESGETTISRMIDLAIRAIESEEVN